MHEVLGGDIGWIADNKVVLVLLEGVALEASVALDDLDSIGEAQVDGVLHGEQASHATLVRGLGHRVRQQLEERQRNGSTAAANLQEANAFRQVDLLLQNEFDQLFGLWPRYEDRWLHEQRYVPKVPLANYVLQWHPGQATKAHLLETLSVLVAHLQVWPQMKVANLELINLIGRVGWLADVVSHPSSYRLHLEHMGQDIVQRGVYFRNVLRFKVILPFADHLRDVIVLLRQWSVEEEAPLPVLLHLGRYPSQEHRLVTRFPISALFTTYRNLPHEVALKSLVERRRLFVG